MKSTILLTTLSISAALCILPFAGLSQEIPVLSTRTAAKPTTEPAPAPVIDTFFIPQMPLSEAVRELKDAITEQNLELANVLIATDVEKISVPALELRHVSGHDALRLIATAAGCDLEVISGTEVDPRSGMLKSIGYHLRAKVGNQLLIPPQPPLIQKEFNGRASGQPGIARPSINIYGLPPAGIAGLSGDLSVPGAMGGIGGGMTPTLSLAQPDAPATRVYSLARIVDSVEFKDFEQTLREMLATANVDLDDSKIALHEKTKVLIVRGTTVTHDAVTQLIAALAENPEIQRAQDQAGIDAKLDALQRDRAMLETQNDELQAELRELQKNLRRLDPGN